MIAYRLFKANSNAFTKKSLHLTTIFLNASRIDCLVGKKIINNTNTSRLFHSSALLLAQDPYQVLGVTRNATDKEIKEAFVKKAKELHPDVNKAPDAQKKFIQVKKAYESLKDAQSRQEYAQRSAYNQQQTHQQQQNPYYNTRTTYQQNPYTYQQPRYRQQTRYEQDAFEQEFRNIMEEMERAFGFRGRGSQRTSRRGGNNTYSYTYTWTSNGPGSRSSQRRTTYQQQEQQPQSQDGFFTPSAIYGYMKYRNNEIVQGFPAVFQMLKTPLETLLIDSAKNVFAVAESSKNVLQVIDRGRILAKGVIEQESSDFTKIRVIDNNNTFVGHVLIAPKSKWPFFKHLGFNYSFVTPNGVVIGQGSSVHLFGLWNHFIYKSYTPTWNNSILGFTHNTFLNSAFKLRIFSQDEEIKPAMMVIPTVYYLNKHRS